MREDYIYFAASIKGGRQDVELYLELIKHLKKYGKILTEHIGNKKLSILGENGLSDKFIHDRDMNWLEKSKYIVAEVTTASLGVGYELGRIIERNLWVLEKKKILCLYRPEINKKLSAMIYGAEDIIVAEYQILDEAKKSIDNFFDV